MSRRAGIATLVVLSVVGLGAGATVVLSQRAVRRLPVAAGRALGRTSAFDGVRLGFLRGPAVSVVGVRISEHPRFDDGRPFLAADALTMRLAIGRLLRGRVTVDRVAVDRPVLRVTRDARGGLNLATIGRPRRRRVAPAPAGAASDGTPRRRGRFRLAALAVRDGVVVFHDRASGRIVRLTGVAADVEAPRFDVPVPLVLRAALEDPSVGAERVETRGKITVAGPASVYDGTLVAGPGRVGRLPYTEVESAVHAEPRALVLDPATIRLPAGVLEGSLRLDGRSPTPLQLGLDGRDIDVARLTVDDETGDPPAEGTLAIEVELTGPAGGPGFLAAAVGSLRAEVVGGRLGAFALGSALRDVLAPVAAGERGARLRRRYPELFGDDGVRFARATASGRIADGRFHTRDLELVGAAWKAHGTGVVALDGRLDLAVRVTASPALADDILGRSRARPLLVDAHGALTVPLRIRGRLGRPRVGIDPAFAPVLAKAAVAHAGYARHPFGDTMSSVLERVLGARSRRR